MTSAQFDHEFRLAMRQREAGRHPPVRGTMPVSDAAERRYHVAMGNATADRGYLNLAQSHLVAAKDCPRGCGCFGCHATRVEAMERRARKAQIWRAA